MTRTIAQMHMEAGRTKITPSEVRQRLVELFSMPRAEVEREFSLRFYTYFRGFFQNPGDIANLLHTAEAPFEILSLEGKTVLDLGCGFGIQSLMMAAHGARRVVALDMDDAKLAVFGRLLRRFFPEIRNITIAVADALSPPLRDRNFHVILLHDVLSHMRDPQSILNSCCGSLSTDTASICVYDGNNALWPFIYLTNRAYWETVEYGGEQAGRLLEGQPHDEPFAVKRRRIIVQHRADLSERQVSDLVRATMGMIQPEIIRAVDEILSSGRTTIRPIFKYRDPLSGEYAELVLNPLTLAKQLKSRGFRSIRFLPPHHAPGGSLPRRLLKDALSAIGKRSPILGLFTSPSFHLIAKRALPPAHDVPGHMATASRP